LAGVPSEAIVIRPITPAVAAAGDAIPNGSALETTFPELSFTVISAVPAFAISVLEI
jgi:hypothetical protein